MKYYVANMKSKEDLYAAAAAKSLQSCPTLCDPVDGSPQAPSSLGFSSQERWSGLPFPSLRSYMEICPSYIVKLKKNILRIYIMNPFILNVYILVSIY